VIPTRSKAKLPAHLSYPLGAEAVSRALAGVPQFDQLTISFRDHPGVSAMAFQAVLRDRRPYVVLKAAFDRSPTGISTSQLLVDAGWHDPKWQITVYPVPRPIRHAARLALLKHALPIIRRWLSHPTATTWSTGHRRLEFHFDPAAATVTGKEVGEVLS